MKSRFVVQRVVERGPHKVRSILLEPFTPEYDGEGDDDPVADIIFDSQLAVTPSDFTLGGIVRDGNIEGTELHAELGLTERPNVGDVLDIEVTIVHRVPRAENA